MADGVCDRRLTFLQSLPTRDTFGKGWNRRIESVRNTAMTIAGLKPSAVTPSVNYRLARKGSRGLWVRKLQEALRIHVDGRFGKGTEVALIAWQKARGIEPDGVAGHFTYRTLGLIA
ncbi:MAG: peptidoglycan-binding protein [Pseudomonadales bacterium]|nr:peptidoglycan-binding protein [Pseudomonadales bacterium]